MIRRLRPVRPPNFELEAIEKRLKRLFLELIFRPILKGEGLPESPSEILNAMTDYPGLELALTSGRLTFHNGIFSGKFNAKSSKELKELGAKWNFGDSTFRISKSQLPASIVQAINTSQNRFVKKIDDLDAKIVKVLSEKPWEKFLLSDLFDKAIFRMDKEFRKNVESIEIQPKITDFQAEKISSEWQNNLEKDIKDFTTKQMNELRETIRESYFKGDRYGSLVKSIQRSYGVTERKAEFLARNETNNLAAAYQGARYEEAGIPGYYWKAVEGTANHPTRHRHRELSQMSDRGKIFHWNNPPVTTEPGEPIRRNNPGQDYNCRCSAIPVYEGKK